MQQNANLNEPMVSSTLTLILIVKHRLKGTVPLRDKLILKLRLLIIKKGSLINICSSPTIIQKSRCFQKR